MRSALLRLSENFQGIEGAPVEVVYLAPRSTAKSFEKALQTFKMANPNLASALEERVRFYPFESLKLSDSTERGDFAGYRTALYKILEALDRKADYCTEGLAPNIAPD